LKRILAALAGSLLFLSASSLWAQYGWSSSSQQQGDVGFAVGTLVAPSSSSASGSYYPQTLSGGTYLTVSGDFLFFHHFGVGSEVSWRASRNLYQGYQPFRPILYDFNAIYAPPLGKHASLELLGGFGGISTHFYTQNYSCNLFTCTNYATVNHALGDVGAGIKLYVHGGVFLRPEFREYFIHDNYEFSSGHATRAGVTLGYTFGRD
jgi:hypothetical protein